MQVASALSAEVENVYGRGFGLSTATKIKHTDVYQQDINYNYILLYYTYNKHC